MEKILLLLIASSLVINKTCAQDPISYNPNNNSASVSLSWHNDISRIRYGGNGIGASNGFQIQGPSNNIKFTVLDNSFIGIGTSSPQRSIHLRSSDGTLRIDRNAPSPGILISRFASDWASTYKTFALGVSGSGSDNGYFFIKDMHTSHGGNGDSRLVIDNQGNIGIGTNSPSNKLEIYRNTGNETVAQFRTDDGTINIAAAGSTTENPTYGNYISSRNANNTAYEDIGLKTASGIPQLLVKTNGSVGIGINNTGTHKLAVEGSIGAREIKVEAGTWSDFVFSNDYELRTLEEVEQHINKNGHLPEIPSEMEVTENGINLGEMNAKLLQKIEELTLYLIEQNKQNQIQQAEIEVLKSKISQLENE